MDIQLSHEEHGTGTPLILLHGNSEDRSYFKAQLTPFALRYRVVAVDTRGHGQTPRGTAPFTLSQFAEDLLALMDSLFIEKANILGFSDGGNIALMFALRYPHRVNRLVLNGANLYPAGMIPVAWLAIDAWYFLACAAGIFTQKARRTREMFGLMATQPHIRPELLELLTMPTLVIAGTHDLIRQKHTRLIARSIPHSHLTLLKGGHTIARDCPEAFNQIVLDFLSKS